MKRTPARRRIRSTALIAIATAAVLAACASTSDDADSNEGAATSSREWEREKAERQRKLDTYLASQRMNFAWFKESPLGFNGVPFVLLKTIIDEYPDIWPKDFLGFGPHPDDYGPDGKLKPGGERLHPLPYGMVFEDVAMNPAETTENVFFSCGACHTGRVVVDGKMKHLYGAPNTEADAQMYTEAILRTAERLHNLEVDPERADTNRSEVLKLIAKMEIKARLDPTWFYGTGRNAQEREANIERARKQVRFVTVNRDAVFESLIGTAIKARLIYQTLPTKSGSYVARDGQQPPGNFGPRPGRMDAYGIASGLVVLHGARRPEYLEKLPENHPFFDGLPATASRAEKLKLAAARIGETAPEWLPHAPAPVDIKSLFMAGDRFHAGWDGNQGGDARVIASGTSAVGDPSKVNLRIHAGMNTFINELPPPPYPFKVDWPLAKRGEQLFKQALAGGKSCADCHSPNNAVIYPLREIGTDPNRANIVTETARVGLIALMREACNGNDWCTPKDANGVRIADTKRADHEYYREIRSPETRGYKADALHGIWTQAPYLHNGSVPTLWHLLNPRARPAKFVRGNVHYDQEKVGFVWDKVPAPNSYDNVRTREFDSSLRGQANTGHTYGQELSDDEKKALLEYLKTL